MTKYASYSLDAHGPTAVPDRTATRRAILDRLDAVRRGKWLILLVFAGVLAGTIAYTYSLAPEYEAYALLMVDERPTASGANEMPALRLFEPGGLGNREVANQALIIQQSLVIAERTAERLLTLRTDPETGSPLPLLAHEADEPAPSARDLALHLQHAVISVEPQQDGVDAIWIRATSPSAREAALVANVFSDEYVQRTRETSRTHLSASRDFLEQQIGALHAELTATEENIRSFRADRGAVDLDEETRLTIGQIANLEAALDEVRIEGQMRAAALKSVEQELGKLQPRLAQRVASTVGEEIEQTQREIASLELYVEQVLTRNPALRDDPEANEDLKTARQKIAQHERRVRALSNRYVDEMLAAGGIDPTSSAPGEGVGYVARLNQQLVDERTALSGLQAKEAALQQRLDGYTRNLRAIPEQSTTLARLERNRQSTEQLYLSLVDKLQEARLAEEAELGFARVIRPAITPAAPVRPRRGLTLGLGALLGLLFGVGAAAARQHLDARIYTPEVLRAGEHPLLTVVPDMRPMIRKEFSKDEHILAAGHQVRTTLAALLTPFSAAAESYRHLYLRLQNSRPEGSLRSVLITSADVAAGKSTTALNLAITAARAGKRTLVVDADLRRPSLRSYMDVDVPADFLALVQGDDASFDPNLLATGLDNLYALPTAASPTTPAGLLSSERMRALLGVFRRHFDLVIFDSPPVLLTTDALVLSQRCDATVIVAASGRTDAHGLTQAVAELREAGATVVGTVLNQFNPSFGDGYYPSYGAHAYYHDQVLLPSAS